MKLTLQKGAQLGFGSFGIVYHATELSTGRAVALKQSRVSLRVKRPLLQYEAQVLKLLSGHPTIPQVYAYDSIKHFEFISMQLLGQSLGDVVDGKGPLPVAVVSGIADQLLSALEHIHSKDLVHRDIKPDNILLVAPGSWSICLIDFGLTYPAPREIPAAKYSTDPLKAATVFGTLTYASLNAHEGLIGQIRQVRAQKKSLDGSRLAAGLPQEFGDLVEYAKPLSAEERPDYQAWRERLGNVARIANQGKPDSIGDSNQSSPDSKSSDPPPPPPIRPGQITLVKLSSSVTAEEYIELDNESIVQDTPEWEFISKPCVILQVGWVGRIGAYKFTALPISANSELEHSINSGVPIIGSQSPSSHSSQVMVSPIPDWPLKHSYVYAFKCPMVFYILPTQEVVPSIWTINPSEVEMLPAILTPLPEDDEFTTMDTYRSPDSDARYDAKIKASYVKPYAQVFPLTANDIAGEVIDWNSTRGWFDECVKALKYHDMCNGYRWTYDIHAQSDEESEKEFSESLVGDPEYDLFEFERWQLHQERDRSFTLAAVLKRPDTLLPDVLEALDKVELVG